MIAFMAATMELLVTYLHLAWAAGKRQRPLVRGRLLLLAGDEALHLGMTDIADFCRLEILKTCPAHLVGKFGTLAEARRSEDLETLVRQLKRRYGGERAERMVASLGLVTGCERETYSSDEEYAAALLGETLASLRAAVANNP